MAEQERSQRNAKYTLHGWLFFLAVIAVLCIIPGDVIIKGFIGLLTGCVIWAVQSTKCKREYERTYHVRVETDDEGNIIHAEKL